MWATIPIGSKKVTNLDFYICTINFIRSWGDFQEANLATGLGTEREKKGKIELMLFMNGPYAKGSFKIKWHELFVIKYFLFFFNAFSTHLSTLIT